MFYSQRLLSKKGSLGVIWVAAFCFSRLKKKQVLSTLISSSVDEILQKEIDVATYRVLGYLLLGLTRIFSKKVEYLCNDSQDIVAKVNNYLVSGKSKTVQSASFGSITIPDSLELDAFDLEIAEDESGGNMLPFERITLRGEASTSGTNELYSFGKEACEEFGGSHETCWTDYATAEIIPLFESLDIDLVGSTLQELSVLKPNMEKHHEKDSSLDEHGDLDKIFGSDGKHAISVNLSGNDQSLPYECIEAPLISQPENGVLGESSTKNHENSRSSGGEDHQSDGDQIRVSPLEESQNEMHQSITEDNYLDGDESIDREPMKVSMIEPENGVVSETSIMFPGVEEVLQDINKTLDDDYNQTDRNQVDPHLGQSEKEIDQAINEENNLSNSEASTEMRLDTEFTQEVCIDIEMACASEVDHTEVSKPSHAVSLQTNIMALSLSSDDNRHQMVEQDPETSVDPTPQSRLLDASGTTAPKFMLPDTPASKNYARRPRRKCCIDDEILLSNDQIKRWKEDTSDLVSNRKSACCNTLRARLKDFQAPLLTGMSSELTSLFHLEKSKFPKTAEVVKSPVRKMTVIVNDRFGQQNSVAPETPVLPLKEKRSLQTPVSLQTPASILHFDSVDQADSSQDQENEPSSSSTDQAWDQSAEELESCEVDKSDLYGLSSRTRVVAKYLQKKFQDRRERNENEAVILNQLLEGKTKKNCARLFYETLVLKSRGLVEVKQDIAFGDIEIEKVPQWEENCALLSQQTNSSSCMQVQPVPRWN